VTYDEEISAPILRGKCKKVLRFAILLLCMPGGICFGRAGVTGTVCFAGVLLRSEHSYFFTSTTGDCSEPATCPKNSRT